MWQSKIRHYFLMFATKQLVAVKVVYLQPPMLQSPLKCRLNLLIKLSSLLWQFWLELLQLLWYWLEFFAGNENATKKLENEKVIEWHVGIIQFCQFLVGNFRKTQTHFIVKLYCRIQPAACQIQWPSWWTQKLDISLRQSKLFFTLRIIFLSI